MKAAEEFDREEKIIAKNKRAEHDYLITYRLECGLSLAGTEVKSLRAGKCSLQDAYAGFENKNDYNLWIYNLHIPEYEFGNRENHKPKRPRRLLVNLREARKLKTQTAAKGMTLIPTAIYFSGHIAKVEIGVAKAKRKYDKRAAEQKKEHMKEIKKKFKI